MEQERTKAAMRRKPMRPVSSVQIFFTKTLDAFDDEGASSRNAQSFLLLLALLCILLYVSP
jgi:hypothetical protein